MPQEEEEEKAEAPCSDIVWRRECWSSKINQKPNCGFIRTSITHQDGKLNGSRLITEKKKSCLDVVSILNFAFQKKEEGTKTHKVGPYQL